uniref:Uncharacterized protein n=1 Tax=Tetraselmis sp. GSL018 TaxID=582737 RepID=A0A061RNA6_9CHLO
MAEHEIDEISLADTDSANFELPEVIERSENSSPIQDLDSPDPKKQKIELISFSGTPAEPVGDVAHKDGRTSGQAEHSNTGVTHVSATVWSSSNKGVPPPREKRERKTEESRGKIWDLWGFSLL